MTSAGRRLRARHRRARRKIGPERQAEHAEAVARAVLVSGVMAKASRVGLYFSQAADGELDTLPLLTRLWAAGKSVSVPVVGARGEMDFYQITPRTSLTHNRYGIIEPRTSGAGSGRYSNPLTLNVLFMPLVAFDDRGSRVGMGVGYYDRFLGRLPESMRPLTVGLAHEVQRAPEPLDRQPWDIPLDAVATDAGWRAFSPRAKVLFQIQSRH
ncbi:MAG: 5-formyltetrahydrofolate cyclo-ligase [Gammaproteobacteria bacterium]|nr:MAG: 5-formyltetrahydrofolate cyclo-ligase [Gammaproteobacteria bacterium]